MKKIVSLLAALLIAISGSVCAFAAQSPGGEIKPDQFNVVGTVTINDNKTHNITVTIGDKSATTDKKGAYRIESIEVGTHTVTFTEGENELGKVSFEIKKGSDTKFEKLPNGTYEITVASNVATINIDFKINEDGSVEITKVSPAGNDSPVSPPLGDMSATVAMFALIISFAGIMISAFFRKRYSC